MAEYGAASSWAPAPDWNVSSPPLLSDAQEEPYKLIPVGYVVLNCSLDPSAPAGELSVSIVIGERYRRRGFAKQTIDLLMRWVFDEIKFHRLQAVIVDSPDRESALSLFTQLCVRSNITINPGCSYSPSEDSTTKASAVGRSTARPNRPGRMPRTSPSSTPTGSCERSSSLRPAHSGTRCSRAMIASARVSSAGKSPDPGLAAVLQSGS